MKNIILIGFKSVGKSAIGKELANQTSRHFVDLDEHVEKTFAEKSEAGLNCRQIMLKIGQAAFRELEHETLKNVLNSQTTSVISLGGGTPMLLENRKLIKKQTVVQITSPKNIVFERIMVNGRPAFFSPDELPIESFNKIWNEREKIYSSLTKIKIDNSGTIGQAVEKIKLII